MLAGVVERFPAPMRRTAILAGLGVVVCGVGVVCGRLAITHYGVQAVLVLAGLPVVVFVARRPVFALVALLAAVASVFAYGSLPRINLPGHPPLNLADVLLIAAVGGTFWRRPWANWPQSVKRYTLAWALFVALAAVATIKTIFVGYDQSRDALYEFRNWLYLGVAITIALELSGRLWQAWLDAAIAFAVVISVVALAGVASPSIAAELLRLDPNAAFSATAVTAAGGVSVGDLTRIRLDGLYFIYAMLLPTLAMALCVADKRRWLRCLAVPILAAAVVVSLNRSMVVAALVGLLITALLGGNLLRRRLTLVSVVAVAVIGVVALGAVAPAISGPIGNRLGSILAPGKVEQSSSYQDRAYELSFVSGSIAKHPWFGVGPRQFYGAYLQTATGTEVRFFVQNLYADIATDYGIPAALAFLLIPLVCLGYGLARLRDCADRVDRALLAAAIGTMVALLLSCLVDVYVQDPNTTVAFGASCGLLLAAAERARRSTLTRT